MSPDRLGSRRRGNFLMALLRGGAPVMATATSELSDEIADPTPIRPIRRIRYLAGTVDVAARDTLLLRAARYVALAPLAYRVIAVPGALAAFIGAGATTGHVGLAPVALVALCSVLLSVFGAFWLLRPVPFDGRKAALLLGADVVFTGAANLVVAAAVPSSVFGAAMQVPGKHLLGGVALLTLALGVLYGGALTVASVPLSAAMHWLNTGQFDPATGFNGFGTLLGVLLTATGALVLVGLGTRLALAYGIRHGRRAERAVQHRMLHDTVLQSLEAMALSRPGASAAEELDALRRLARAEASQLRARIESDAGGSGTAGSRPLGEKLAALAAEMARDGLRAQVVVAELDDETLSEARQLAVRDAVREALRNTMKHAGTDKVVVRVEERSGGIATIIRDHGTGFGPEAHPGFGISESINARLAEVGGNATVESTPGNGTRVTLWVPS